VGAGSFHEVVVDVDGGDVAPVADEVGEEGGVVAGAGAQFEDAFARLRVELVEHEGDDAGLGRAGDRCAVGVVLDADRAVRVGVLEGGVGHEQVAGDGPQRGLDRGGADVSGRGELVGQLVAQSGGLVEVCGGGCGHVRAFRSDGL
jgi:hypothetical protein